MPSFDEKLALGRTAESAIAKWLMRRGWSILPVYEKAENEFKGPQVFSADRELVAPDMCIFKPASFMWVEAKNKSAFSWHRLTSRWTTGIDLRHYRDYIAIAERSTSPLWLMFMQGTGTAKGSPANIPPPAPGLYGNELAKLRACENHRSNKWGSSGMVYWAVGSLRFIATSEEVLALPAPPTSTWTATAGQVESEVCDVPAKPDAGNDWRAEFGITPGKWPRPTTAWDHEKIES